MKNEHHTAAPRIEGPDRLVPVSASDLFQHYCRLANKWGLYLRVSECPEDGYADHIRGATMLEPVPAPAVGPGDAGDVFSRLLYEGAACLFFDTRAEMEAVYGRIVGDEGPTESNPYDGPCRVYALTCRNDGQLLNENT